MARRNRSPGEAGEARGSVAENEAPESQGLGDQSEERSELAAKKVPTSVVQLFLIAGFHSPLFPLPGV